MNRRELLRGSAFAFASATLAGTASAQAKYPDRPIHLIVPRPAGGVVDVIGREWANGVRETLGTVVIDNMGGAGGVIGANAAARAAPDGYTLFLGSTSELVLSPIIKAQSYDTERDFRPVAIMALSMGAIAVHPSVPVHNLKELVAYAKANAGKLSYGSAGAGTSSNLTGELFKHLAGLPDIVHIPYKGANPGIADLVAGQIPMMTPMISGGLVDLHNTGKVRILGVAAEQRVSAAPNIPTGAEQGYADWVAQLFMGLFTQRQTPQPIVDQLVRATAQVMQDKALQNKLTVAGFEPVTDSTPEKSAKYIKEEVARWTPVLTASGMKQG